MRLDLTNQPSLQIPCLVFRKLDAHQILGGPGPTIEQGLQRLDLFEFEKKRSKLTCRFCALDATEALGHPHTRDEL